MARTTKGRLYTRGKKGYYYLQYYINGQQFRVALKDDAGNGITTEKKAKDSAAKILLPLTAKTEADRLRLVTNELQAIEAKAETAEAANINSKATIANGWSLFMECPKRPASCKRYPADAIPRHTTAANYRSYYERFTGWLQDNHRAVRLLSDITPEAASAFMDTLQHGAASGTFNKYLQFFNCFFDTLAGAGKINSENPFKEIDRADHRYNSKRPLTVEQIKLLIDTAAGDMRLLVALGYFTGLRLGDCCTLQWREVDLLRGVIERIPRKTAHTVKDKEQAIVKIGIAPFLFEMLAAIPEEERKGYILPTFAERYLAGRGCNITRDLMNLFRSCGIQVYREGTGPEYRYEGKKKINISKNRAVIEIGFHSLRYSYISHNAEAGTPAAVIQRNAGHSNPAMTEHYTRISDRAAVQYATALQLPTEEPETMPEGEAAARAEFRVLADSLPIEQIHEIINRTKGK